MTVLLTFCPCPLHSRPPHTAPAARQIFIPHMPARPLLEAFACKQRSYFFLPMNSPSSFKAS